jgi:phosphatidylglycerophosphate synthase
MFGIAFMVYQEPLFGIDIYAVGFALLVVAAVMTIWSMIIYLKAAWPYIMADQPGDGSGE